ncbi:MAG: FlgD immunoglobulin-like domain containing protein, partial [Fidelibacterota bacterium]
VDAGNEDFHLQSNSPCINAGDPDIDGDGTTWENDHDDQDPDGTIVDMGAFYHANIISNITISSNPDTLSILNLNDTIAIAFNAQFNPATIEPNVELSSRENGSVPFEIFMNNNNSSFSISPLLKYPMTDTITITLNQGIISPDGYAFDYTNDGLLSDYNLKFLTPWLGDYNSDFSINFDDFIIFRDTWWERDQMDITPYELHPFSGTLPFVILQPDTNFAYDDLMTFIWMWNWSQAQNSVMRIDPFQEVGSTNSRIMFTPYYSNYDPSGQNLSIPIELELTINNPETVSSIEIILSYNPDELSFDDIQYTSPIDCNDCDWINLEYNTVESNQIIMNMVAFNKYRLLQPGINLLNSIKFQADGQDSITIEYSYDIRYDGEISLKGEVGSGNYTLKMVNALPEGFTLFQNYPNPFNPITTLRYELPERAHVQLKIYDILGREIRQLVYQEQDAGYKSVTWDGRDNDGRVMGAGMYLYRIHAGEFVRTKKMVLLK